MNIPRLLDTYRGARRNAFIKVGVGFSRFEGWRNWMQANVRAKLAERREQCKQARSLVGRVLEANVRAKLAKRRLASLITDALLVFWQAQKRTRVVSRICRDLAHA